MGLCDWNATTPVFFFSPVDMRHDHEHRGSGSGRRSWNVRWCDNGWNGEEGFALWVSFKSDHLDGGEHTSVELHDTSERGDH